MKRLLIILSVHILSLYPCYAQLSVHQAAHFSSAGGITSLVANYIDVSSGFGNNKNRTFEAWVKRDNVDASRHTVIHGPSFGFGPNPILYMYQDGDSLYASYGSFKTSGYYPPDTNWHHISFIAQPNSIHDTTWVSGYPVSVAHLDTNALYIDGVLAGTRRGTHINVGSGAGTLIAIGYFENTSGGLDFWDGHITRIVFYDSVLHSSSFIPDCIYDTSTFFSAGSIDLPCRVLVPLNEDNSSYYYGMPMVPLVGALAYAYETSPCAPTFLFYCPPSDTITYGGTDTLLKAVNTNASYMKGSHIPMHKNGWLVPSSVVADYTVGVFTDTLVVTTPGSYPYISSYGNDTQKVVVILHDDGGAAGVENVLQNTIQLYPNPVKSQLTINGAIGKAKIRVTNLLGQEIFNTMVIDGSVHIDVSSYSPGLYFIVLNDSVVARFIKE